MSLDNFQKIVQKAKSEGYDIIGIYNWIEPFLSKALDSFVALVKENGLFCHLSSNLSLKPDSYFDIIYKALAAGVDDLIVSVSGYNQEVYEINHVGGNISWVKENLEQIAKLKHDGTIDTSITLRFIKFDYNSEEEFGLNEYAESYLD